jgi:hypothetical protein
MAETATSIGAPTYAPTNYRRDASDASGLLASIEFWLRRTDMAPSTFGRQAVRDPRLIGDLRRGASITARRAARIRAYMEGR